ncbi:unnamed protein product [Trichobilharzia regenti]|nr:unnamed protein product [Trichobilharzia regenti]
MIVFTLSHLSSCLVALLSVERFFAVYLPYHKFIPSIDCAGSILLIILCTCINLIHLKYTTLEVNQIFQNINLTLPEPGLQAKLHTYICVNPSTKIAILVDVFDVLILFGLPFLIILMCNSYVIWKLKKHSKKLKQSVNYSKTIHPIVSDNSLSILDGDNGRHRSYSMIPLRSNYRTNSNPENPTTIFSTLKSCQKESTGIANVMSYATKRHLRITKMLLIVTFAFLICNLPFAIIHVIRTADETRRSYSWNKAWLISYLLVYINNCMNFPIYIISQPPFRSELKEMFYRYSKRETMTQHHATSPVIG